MLDFIYNVFSNIFALILALIGFALIVFTIYMRIKDLKLRKKGKIVKLKVKSIKELKNGNKNNKEFIRGYSTTFEFIDNDIKKEETIPTSKKFKVGSIKKGIFFEDGKANILSVDGEGFYFSKGGELFFISFGFMIILFAS